MWRRTPPGLLSFVGRSTHSRAHDDGHARGQSVTSFLSISQELFSVFSFSARSITSLPPRPRSKMQRRKHLNKVRAGASTACYRVAAWGRGRVHLPRETAGVVCNCGGGVQRGSKPTRARCARSVAQRGRCCCWQSRGREGGDSACVEQVPRGDAACTRRPARTHACPRLFVALRAQRLPTNKAVSAARPLGAVPCKLPQCSAAPFPPPGSPATGRRWPGRRQPWLAGHCAP